MKKDMAMNKKAAILLTVMLFLIIATISSIGLYNSVYQLSRMQGIGEIERIRGYYAALGGLRYTIDIASSPGNYIDNGTGVALILPTAGSPGPIHIRVPATLIVDLGLTGSENLAIDITYVLGSYRIDATFTH